MRIYKTTFMTLMTLFNWIIGFYERYQLDFFSCSLIYNINVREVIFSSLE